MENHLFPPEVFKLTVEAIACIHRGKRDVFNFFKMCGVEQFDLAEAKAIYEADQNGTKKTLIAETVLHRLISRKDAALFQRREILRRLSQYEDFGSCWESDQFKARGYVAELARIVNIKDSFTRIERERESERAQRLVENQQLISARHAKRERMRDIKLRLTDLLVSAILPLARGRDFERVMTDLFTEGGLSIREPFTVRSDRSGLIVEQIDGAVEIRGSTFLVECKSRQDRISHQELAPHLVSVYNRGNVGGIFISTSGFTESALSDAKAALSKKTILLLEIGAILACLESETSIAKFIEENVREVELSRNPLGQQKTA